MIKYITIGIFMSGMARLYAQAPAEERILQPLPPSFSEAGPAGTTQVDQQGWDHRAVVQTQDSYVQVQQAGESHVLQATQQGLNGQWVIHQQGRRNEYLGSLTGDNNRVEVLQQGEDNLIRQDLVGNDMQYRLIQQGQGNELIQLEHDPLAPSYEVHQQGQGMKINIEQGFVGLPPLRP